MRTNIFLFMAILICFASCKNEQQSAYITSGEEVDLISEKFNDYLKGNWDNWINYYADSAKIYYNTRYNPMTAKQAAEMHKGSVTPLSSYRFDDVLIERLTTEDSSIKVTFRGYWIATLSGNGKEFEIPTQAYYKIKEGKIIEEHGFWDNSIYFDAYEQMIAEKEE